jgi:iron complex transport system ATP-binding protein
MEKRQDEILKIESLTIGYGAGKSENILFPPLNATANRGELIALIGRNGIGKSTLLKTLTGLLPPIGGSIEYARKNIKDYSRILLAQKVGYISTEIVRVSNMKVYDLVALGRFPHTNWIGNIDSRNQMAILDSLEKTGMSGLSGRLVTELSDGERQRAMIARLLAQDTGIMVMDEPTAFLDIGSKFEILHLMHQLSHKGDKTIIFSTHDLHMAINQSDKIWLMLDDRLIEGAPEDLMLKGVFDHLFDTSNVQFNKEHGTFSFRNESRGSIFVGGTGIQKKWTEKAVERAGFNVSDKKMVPYITVPDRENANWQLATKNSFHEFQSIYELVMWMDKKETEIN